jgi:hypothetical protein
MGEAKDGDQGGSAVQLSALHYLLGGVQQAQLSCSVGRVGVVVEDAGRVVVEAAERCGGRRSMARR